MKAKIQFGLAIAALTGFLFGASVAEAQRTAHGVTAAPAPTSARARTGQPAGITRGAKTGNQKANTTLATNPTFFNSEFFGSSVSVQDLLNPFPAPGFSFDHLFALNRDLELKALIDPATQARLAVAERLLRETPAGPGFFLLDGGGSYVVPMVNDQPQAQQPIIIVQQPAQQAAAAPAEPAPQAVEQEPLPDVGEFTLVLRDGTEIQASAFTRSKDKIVYVTPAGYRRTISTRDLDSDATMRLNQERGTPLQLPL